jgi:hypothetical protein
LPEFNAKQTAPIPLEKEIRAAIAQVKKRR